MKVQSIEKQIANVQKAIDKVDKIIKKAQKTFYKLESSFGFVQANKAIDNFAYTIAELKLPKVNVSDFLFSHTNAFTPILDLHIGRGFTSLNNSAAILKTNHTQRLFCGETASFSWEMAALLLYLPEQTNVVFIKNEVGQYDIYLPILNMLFSNENYKDKSANDKVVNRLQTVYGNFKQDFLEKCIRYKTLFDVPTLDKNLEYFKFEFKVGQDYIQMMGIDKDGDTLTCERLILDASQEADIEGLYGLNKSVLEYVKAYFGLDDFDNKVEMNLYFRDVSFTLSKNSHPLQFFIFERGDKQALVMSRYIQ